MMMDALTRLIAIEEIKQLKARYFRCMDMKNWDEFRTVFHKDIVVDSSAAFTPVDFAGKPIEPGLPIVPHNPDFRVVGVDAFLEAEHHYLTNVSTVHHGHMPEIEILSETTAKGIWAMEDKLRYPQGNPTGAKWMHGYGHYWETYEKLTQGWVIKTLKLTRIRFDQELY